MKNIFVVLSPPRSGSSCLARGLQALGIDLGTDLMAPAVQNPKGFFEDNELRSINKQLGEYLKRFENGETNLNPFQSELFSSACNVLNNRFQITDNFAFKDPQTVKFLPFWKKVFETSNLNDNYIIALRNPLCFSHSMYYVPFEKTLLMWISNLLSACELSINKKRIVVDYDRLIDNPRHQLERISKTFDLLNLQNESEIKLYCDEFVDKSLHHHRYTLKQLESNQRIFPFCISFYTFLLNLACDEISFTSKKFETEWQILAENVKENALLYRYIEKLLTQNDVHEIELQRTKEICSYYEKSLSWRITKPLRKIQKLTSWSI